jgi:preprotein translocase subunit SecA
MIFNKIFGTYSEKEIKRLNPTVNKIESLDSKISMLSDDKLRAKTDEFKDGLLAGETLDDILPEAFAVVREASKRVLGLKHFREQLVGGIIIHQGRIAEMKTGEGKTLVATLPAYLNALTGKGVHVVTVNDYLAKRDKEYLQPLYEFLGLTVGVILHDLSNDERRKAYNADVTYGTNHEFGFDYLRDNMVFSKNNKVQRELNFAIVDEVDSILIDEARTPLIISSPDNKIDDYYRLSDIFAKSLKEKTDFTIDEKAYSVLLTANGVKKAEQFFNIANFGDINNIQIQHNVIQALKANYIMKLDKDYIIKNGKVVIVDEFTGRIMEGRRYDDGLHQAIEAKEMVKINNESKTLASITFQNYFRLYSKLSGMTGTALTEETEFRQVYNLDTVAIPTHKPVKRIDYDDVIYKTRKAKLNAIVNDIIETHKTGQPILVGTVSVEKSEELSNMLKKHGIPHQVLNAKFNDKEAEIISHAGEKGTVTIATNMAGRGTDIKLGEGVVELGGLKIIGTERHEARRIDNQLRGRSGRQGDPGSSQFYISLEDDLLRIFGTKQLSIISKNLDENKPINNKAITKAIENTQKIIEGNNLEARIYTLNFDDIINEQRKIIYKQRNQVLDGMDVSGQIKSMIHDVIVENVRYYLGRQDFNQDSNDNIENCIDDIVEFMNTLLPSKLLSANASSSSALLTNSFITKINKDMLKDLSTDEIIEQCFNIAIKAYQDEEQIQGSKNMREIERIILLKVVDMHWIQYTDDMDQLKQSIGLCAYRQLDPVQEYQIQSGEMFKKMIYNIKHDTIAYIFNLQ